MPDVVSIGRHISISINNSTHHSSNKKETFRIYLQCQTTIQKDSCLASPFLKSVLHRTRQAPHSPASNPFRLAATITHQRTYVSFPSLLRTPELRSDKAEEQSSQSHASFARPSRLNCGADQARSARSCPPARCCNAPMGWYESEYVVS